MKGTNTIQLNYDSVVEAITEYLAKRMVTPPIVKAVGINACVWSEYHAADHAQPGSLAIKIQEPIEFLKGGK